ncbi:Uncharacterised protein [Turicibacter sanguinis]|nr:Uncharacterised protein [Turicibacter sanguinis]
MLIYILQIVLIIAFYLLFSYKGFTRRKEKYFLCITFLILAIVAGIRNYTVGYDTPQYVIAYKKAAGLSFSQFSLLRYEYGFTFLCVLLNKITANPQILIFITSLFINFSIVKFISKNSKNKLLSILIYLLLNHYFFYTSAMRQALAVSIILLGFDNLKNKKYIKFTLYVLIASLFHQSAILALLFILFNNKKYNKNFVYQLLIIFVVFFIFGKNIFNFLVRLSPRLAGYSTSKFNVENYFGAFFQFILNLILFGIGYLITYKYEKNLLKDRKNPNNIYIGILAVANIFSLLTMKVSIFNRFSPYFSIFIIIWLPNSIVKIQNPKNKIFITTVIVSCLFCYWVIINYFRPEWYGMIPYSIFD